MTKKKTKTSSAPEKAPAKKAVAVEEEEVPAFDPTPVVTIRLSPEDAKSKSLEVLRLFMNAYEDL